MNYGTRPEKVASLLTSVANFSGTSGFITQEYNNFLDFIHAVVPCVQATTAPPTTVAPSTTQARNRLPGHPLKWFDNMLVFIAPEIQDEESTTLTAGPFEK